MSKNTFFLTGATGLIGGAALSRMLDASPNLRVYALVRDPTRWARLARRLGPLSGRVVPLVGDLRAGGLGLGAANRLRLRDEVSSTVHVAGDIVFSRPLEQARATNVEGTRNLLDLSADWRGKVCFVSTAFVAGRREGAVLESDLGGEAGWVNAYEQSKWEAEQLVRASGRPFTILRSSTVVCDSVAGEVSQYNAVHRALRLFYHGLAPMLPGCGTSPVDLVTADYVGHAISALALRDDLDGRCYHLCAGDRALSLGDLLDLTHRFWASEPAWRRRSIALPVLCGLETYRLFEQSVCDAADARLQQVVRSLSHFVPQLALAKRFDTSGADTVLGFRAPDVREYWPGVLRYLSSVDWLGAGRRAA
jgi:nucleoside-diphosphate-sugar epimerase